LAAAEGQQLLSQGSGSLGGTINLGNRVAQPL